MKTKFTLSTAAIITAIILLCIPKANAQEWHLTGNSDATSGSKLGTLSNIPLKIVTNKKPRIYVTGLGNVGIDTTAPDSVFSVNGTASFTNHVKIGTEDVKKPLVFLRFGPFASMIFDRNQFIWRHSYSQEGMFYNNDKSRIEYRDQLGVANMWLEWVTRGNSYFRGNMGIGTENPTRKLQVQDGDIRISASIPGDRYFEFINTAANKVDYRFDHDAISGHGQLYLSSSANDFTSFSDKAFFDTAQTYTFTVFGKALANTWVDSDAKLKKNIKDVSTALSIVQKLKPRTYTFKTIDYPNLNLPGENQYGFIAQELENVLPELVGTSKQPVRITSDGKREMEDIKSVNYTELIPLLTKAIQEQQQEINDLKESVKILTAAINQNRSALTVNKNNLSNASLQQNIPNPANNATIIKYILPEQYASAKIIIVDKTGTILKEVNLSGNGKGSIKVDASTLASGAYNYSLYVDGKLIDTKQMILSK